ncbi:hypothetical protein A6R68_12111 [Neotoma lepida]|uniref:Protein phosphatase 1 regulatory subunit 14 n=1 Tax=Neotoma lepida TaxID=56216 RepID=A0A1A6H4R2_NEOLE|nr:hypothetical protein A6R68_12111 [Neotoma lepida]
MLELLGAKTSAWQPPDRRLSEVSVSVGPSSCRKEAGLLAQSNLSMLSPNPASCTSPKPDTDNPDKKVHWASEKRRRTSSTDSDSKAHLDISKLPRSRRPSRLTVKYDRGHLQRWLEMEQWVDAQVQELFQGQEAPEPEIDLEALMELSTEEQRTQLEVILHDCPCDREILRLLSLGPGIWCLVCLCRGGNLSGEQEYGEGHTRSPEV